MERWHLSLLLAAGAAVGALVAPQLRGRDAPDERVPDTIPEVSIVDVPMAEPIAEAWDGDGALVLDARIDQSRVLEGAEGLRYVVVNVTAPVDEPAIGHVGDFRRGIQVVRTPVALHIEIPSGVGGDAYPVSLLGVISFVRQSFIDAQHQQVTAQRAARRAPWAKIARSVAQCDSSMRSPAPKK